MQQCPLCYTELEVTDCSPCDDCGWNVTDDNREYVIQRNEYNVYDVYKGLRLTLCNVCYLEFGNYKSYFNGKSISPKDIGFVKKVENPEIHKDKFCPECCHKQKFLDFVVSVREMPSKL